MAKFAICVPNVAGRHYVSTVFIAPIATYVRHAHMAKSPKTAKCAPVASTAKTNIIATNAIDVPMVKPNMAATYATCVTMAKTATNAIHALDANTADSVKHASNVVDVNMASSNPIV